MIKVVWPWGVIQSTHQFLDFILKATKHFSLRLSSRIIPHHEHEGPHHQGAHPRRLIIVWPILYFVQFCGSSYSNRFILLQEVYTFTHTIRSPMSRENMKCRNEAHVFHQSSQALLRRLPMADTNWLRYTWVRGADWHP